MSNKLLDDIEINSNGVLIEKHHSQARLMIFLYTSFVIFYLLVMTEYKSLGKYDIIVFGGKLLFFGFVLYYNFKQLKTEKTNEKSYPHFPKWETLLFVLFMGMLLIHSIKKFINIISENWYSFPTLVFFCIVISILIIIPIEIKYLILKRRF